MMASQWLRMRMYHLGKIKVSKLFTLLGVVGVVYIIYKTTGSAMPRSFGIVKHKYSEVAHAMSPQEINRHLGLMEDTRPNFCQDVSYSNLKNEFYSKVSIIMEYKDEQFYDLKLTLNSIFMYTPNHQFSEIIVIDDGTTNDKIHLHAAEFFKDPKFHNVKVYRSDKSEGQSVSRFKGSQIASGDTLVFLGSDVVVNQGWLQPLLAKVQESPETVVVPHHDNFLPGYRFFGLDNGLINIPTWPLTTVYMETSMGTENTLNTPVMRGEAFVISKRFMKKLGDFDDNLDSGGGHNLEFSLRTWLCGGKIQIALCSRVAVHSTLRPQEVTSHDNLRHIAEMWLGEYKYIAYKQSQVSPELTDANKNKLKARKTFLKNTLKNCNSFSWYLNNVATDLLVPSESISFFGKLKAETNLCLRSESQTSSVVEMELCRPHIYDKAFLFEMDLSGSIKTGDRCLSVDRQHHVVLEQCREYFDQQQWTLEEDGRLQNRGLPGKCASQVSERDAEGGLRHYVMVLDCEGAHSRTQTWTVISY